MSVVLGTATVWVTYRFARRVANRATALVAAFFLAVAYLHVRDSHFGVSDAPLTFLVAAAMLMTARVWSRPDRLRRWIAAGAVTGLAASTKYNGGAVALVAIAIAASTLTSGAGRRRWRLTAVGLVTFGLAAAAAFLAGTPFAVLDHASFLEGLTTQMRHLEEGHAGLDLGRGWTRHLTFSLRYGVGVPLLASAMGGAALLAIRDWRKALLVCTFPAAYYTAVGAGHTVFVRYMTPVVPLLCVMAAIAVTAAARRFAPLAPALPGILTVAAAALVSAPTAVRSVEFDRVLAQTDTRVLAARWLDERMEADDTVYESGFTAGWARGAWRGPDRDRPILSFDDQRGIFTSASGEQVVPRWLVIQESPLGAYSQVPCALRYLAHADYEVAASFSAVRHAEPAVIFDRQDAFFLPFTRFTDRVRPGPELTVYRRARR